MKRIAAFFLVLLLLTGCSSVGTPAAPASGTESGLPAVTEAEPAQQTDAAPVTEAQPEEPAGSTAEPDEPGPAGPEDLNADDAYLFVRQDQIENDRLADRPRGDLVSEAEVLEWHDAQVNLPRTHYFDEAFRDSGLLLELLDYCIFHGYAGVVMTAAHPELDGLSEEQFTDLWWMYRVDDGYFDLDYFSGDTEGTRYAAIWICCRNSNSMARFSEALEEARRIVGEMPEGLCEYDAAYWLYYYLKTNLKYDTKSLSYYNYEWSYLYDALIDKLCVCTGFSDALYYLYNLAGIDCLVVNGPVAGSDFNQAQNHQWNLARLSGQYYCFDVTWDSTAQPVTENAFFAVSEAMLDSVSERTYRTLYSYDIPPCEAGFVPPEEWGRTPEGALRTYLWLWQYCCGTSARNYLIQSDQLGFQDPPINTMRGQIMVFDLDYSAFTETMLRYVTQFCYRKNFEGKYYRDEDGKLAVYAGGGDAVPYRIESVSEDSRQFTAQLITPRGSRATAVFTLAEEDGRLKVNTIRIKGS